MTEEIPFYYRNARTIKIVLLAWLVVGWIFYFGAVLWAEPWGPKLGVANSPMRSMLSAAISVLTILPTAFYQMAYFCDHKEWVSWANGEEYVEGTYPKIMTTKRIITCAIGAAMFGASGAFFAPNLDVPGIIWNFLAAAYDPIVCWFAVSFGFALIRGPLFTGIWDPFAITRVFCNDAPTLMFAALIWWRWLKPAYRKGERSLVATAAIYTFFGWLIHAFIWNFSSQRITMPDPAFFVSITTGWPGWLNPWQYIQIMAFKVIGFYMGVAAGRYTWVKRKEYVR